MSDRFSDSDASREALSALADGEAQSHEVARACAAWKEQADARATWHAYQLIGDVMRSDDLAQASRGDAFLKSFRERLAQEPVVLAPSAASAHRPVVPAAGLAVASQPLHRRAWAGPMAVAAGFVMVVGALLSSQFVPLGNTGGHATMAQGADQDGRLEAGGDLSLAMGQQGGQWHSAVLADTLQTPAIEGGAASFSRPETGDTVLIRDPRLDQLLAMQQREARAAGDESFSGQGHLTRQVVFDAR